MAPTAAIESTDVHCGGTIRAKTSGAGPLTYTITRDQSSPFVVINVDNGVLPADGQWHQIGKFGCIASTYKDPAGTLTVRTQPPLGYWVVTVHYP